MCVCVCVCVYMSQNIYPTLFTPSFFSTFLYRITQQQLNEVPCGKVGETRTKTARARHILSQTPSATHDGDDRLDAYQPHKRFKRRCPSAPNQLSHTELSVVISDEAIAKIRSDGQHADPNM